MEFILSKNLRSVIQGNFSIKDLISGSPYSIFFEFHKPPYGGGNQFLLALRKELRRHDVNLSVNKWNRRTECVLVNSYNFSFERFLELKKKYPSTRIIHRIDGPISVYRGTDDNEIDRKIAEFNQRHADTTIVQSRFSFEAHKKLGFEYKDPHIIHNAADPTLFYPGPSSNNDGRKIKLIGTAWSNNKKKGLEFFEFLDDELDFNLFELTFVGRIDGKFKNIRVRAPLPSQELGALLQTHDIYIAASQDDPCSNALIEALTCGLPAVFHNSGGHPELVKNAGERFETPSDLLSAIDRVSKNIPKYKDFIKPPSITEVARQYADLIK